MTSFFIALFVALAAAVAGWRLTAARRRVAQTQASREQATQAASASAAASQEMPTAKPARSAEDEAARATARAKAQQVIATEQARRKAAIQKAQNVARAEADRRAREAEAAALASTLPSNRLPQVERTTPLPPRPVASVPLGEKTAPLVRAVPPARRPERPSVLKTAAQTLVLLVDDSKMVRVKTSRLLAAHGFQVQTAVDGVDALAQLETCCPDLVITDVDMPGMDGFGLVNALRGNPRTQHLPIVMITSAEDRHREEALRVGVGLVMGKPYDEVALVAHLRSFSFYAKAEEAESLACA